MPSPSITSLLQQFHNARDWGADASGNRDASQAIQDALRAVSDGGGGILFVPPGIYRLDSSLSFSGLSRVTLWLANGVQSTGAGSWPSGSGTNSVLDQRDGAVAAPVGSTVPTASAPGDTGAAGTLSEAARADHRHGREAFGSSADITTQAFGDAPAAGATGRVADAGHRHGMPPAPVYTVANVTAAQSPYTVPAWRYAVLVDASGGPVTVNLPTAVGNTGSTIEVKKIDSSGNAVTVDAAGTETIDGAATLQIVGTNDSYTLLSDGANVRII